MVTSEKMVTTPACAGQSRCGAVLVISELRLQRDVLSQALALLRPGLDVQALAPDELVGERWQPSPVIVVSTVPQALLPRGIPCWILLHPERSGPCIVYLHGVATTHDHLSFESLLMVIDEAVRTVEIY